MKGPRTRIGRWRERVAAWGFLSALVASLSPAVARADEMAKEPELTVFVGRLAEVRQLEYDCGRGCWNFDSGYRLRYSVLEAISGDVDPQEESFDFFGHYGLPDFTHYDTALLFVFKGDKENVMARYLAFPVARTDTGAWAFCGNPYPEEVSRADRPAFHRVRFQTPIAASDITAAYRDDMSWSGWKAGMKPGRKRCGNAALAEELAAYFRPGAEPGYNRIYLFSE